MNFLYATLHNSGIVVGGICECPAHEGFFNSFYHAYRIYNWQQNTLILFLAFEF